MTVAPGAAATRLLVRVATAKEPVAELTVLEMATAVLTPTGVKTVVSVWSPALRTFTRRELMIVLDTPKVAMPDKLLKVTVATLAVIAFWRARMTAATSPVGRAPAETGAPVKAVIRLRTVLTMTMTGTVVTPPVTAAVATTAPSTTTPAGLTVSMVMKEAALEVEGAVVEEMVKVLAEPAATAVARVKVNLLTTLVDESMMFGVPADVVLEARYPGGRVTMMVDWAVRAVAVVKLTTRGAEVMAAVGRPAAVTAVKGLKRGTATMGATTALLPVLTMDQLVEGIGKTEVAEELAIIVQVMVKGEVPVAAPATVRTAKLPPTGTLVKV